MQLRGIAFPGLILCIILGCSGAALSPRTTEGRCSVGTPKKDNEDVVLAFLLPALKSARKPGRLYYRAACQADMEDPVPFPSTVAQPPSKGKTGLAGVQEIFQNDKDVTVTETPSGIVRIRIGDVPGAILQTKISVLRFDRDQEYDPNEAIRAIERTKEVKGAMRSLGVALPLDLGGLVAQPEKGQPHLPPVMKDVTVDQALDSVAETFTGGVVVYGACTESEEPGGPRLFWIGFAGDVD